MRIYNRPDRPRSCGIARGGAMIIIEILQIIHAMIAIIAGWISGDLAVDLGLTFAWRRPVLKSKAKYRGALSFAVLGVIIIPQKWRKDERWRRWGTPSSPTRTATALKKRARPYSDGANFSEMTSLRLRCL